MPDEHLLDVAISQATKAPGAEELVRQSRRYEELRTSSAWAELREEFKQRRENVTKLLGQKALTGVDGHRLRDEGIYARGFLDGMEMLLDRPEKLEERLEALIMDSYREIVVALEEAAEAQSPYAV